MIYRIHMDVMFSELPSTDWLRRIRTYIENHAITINPGQPNEEHSNYQFEKCYHDERPLEDCQLIDSWESE